MKYMLRQVKSMDSTLPKDYNPTTTAATSSSITKRSKVAKATPSKPKPVSLTSRNENGEVVTAEDMDVALLVLYGHILYSGNSFYPALNYFLRAYALDPENPSILLSIALCYIHHALKRQADNRHYLILQGFSFMSLYRNAREKKKTVHDADDDKTENSSLIVERQEVQFNYGRVYHSLGLLHQAVSCYERALEMGDQISASQEKGKSREGDQNKFVEDFSPEAALALQNIYALNGDFAGARRVTERYLVI
jgi:general transcription factor 3C polypeptide 3 (transcription factor C subunit 4)